MQLSLLRLTSDSSQGTLWANDRSIRALILCLGADLAMWLGLRAWLREHARAMGGKIDTGLMRFYVL